MTIKKDFERNICREFMNSSNVIPPCNTTYSLIEDDREAPDFFLQDSNGNKIGLEITSAYHNQELAKGYWKSVQYAKEGSDSYQDVVMSNPDKMLIPFIKNRIEDKCKKDYGQHCILIIHVEEPVWSDRKLKQIREIPKSLERNPFPVIYICVVVPHSNEFSPNAGKMTFFRIYPYTNKLHNLDQETYKKLKKDFEKRCQQFVKMTSEDIKSIFKDLEF